MFLSTLNQWFDLNIEFFKFWIQNQKFAGGIIFIVSLFIYPALSQKEQILIVFSNKHSGSNMSVPQHFP